MKKKFLCHTKFKEFNNLTEALTLDELGKKFNISAEGVRKISIKKFEEFTNILIKNKKKVGKVKFTNIYKCICNSIK